MAFLSEEDEHTGHRKFIDLSCGLFQRPVTALHISYLYPST